MRRPKTRPAERLQRLCALADKYHGMLMRAWLVFDAVAKSHENLSRVGRAARAKRRGLLKEWQQKMNVFCALAEEIIELDKAREA